MYQVQGLYHLSQASFSWYTLKSNSIPSPQKNSIPLPLDLPTFFFRRQDAFDISEGILHEGTHLLHRQTQTSYVEHDGLGFGKKCDVKSFLEGSSRVLMSENPLDFRAIQWGEGQRSPFKFPKNLSGKNMLKQH